MTGPNPEQSNPTETSAETTVNYKALFNEAKGPESSQTAQGQVVDLDGQLVLVTSTKAETGELNYKPLNNETIRTYLQQERERLSPTMDPAALTEHLQQERLRITKEADPASSVQTSEEADAATRQINARAREVLREHGPGRGFAWTQERAARMTARAAELSAIRESGDPEMRAAHVKVAAEAKEEAGMWRSFAEGQDISGRMLFEASGNPIAATELIRGRVDSYRQEIREQALASRQADIADARAKIEAAGGDSGAGEALPEIKIPEDVRERNKFVEENFSQFSPDRIPQFEAYIRSRVEMLRQAHQEGAKYPDTVSGLLGLGQTTPNFMRDLVNYRNAQESRPLVRGDGRDMKQPFSELVKEYLGVDLKAEYPDYDKVFGRA